MIDSNKVIKELKAQLAGMAFLCLIAVIFLLVSSFDRGLARGELIHLNDKLKAYDKLEWCPTALPSDAFIPESGIDIVDRY